MIEKARREQLERCIPNIWEQKEILYVGAGPYRHHFFDAMQKHQCDVDVVEIDEKNCEWLKKEHRWLGTIIHDDIVHFLCGYTNLNLDFKTFLWSHGIEMIEKIKGEILLGSTILENTASKYIIHMTPYGDAGGTGNVSVWYPKDFEDYGYKTDTLGKKDERNSNLLAWKVL